MKFRIALSVLVVALVGAGAWYAVTLRNRPPEVPFARVTRGTIESTIPTNGKVEPIEWAEAHTDRPGPVSKILVRRGERVALGAPLIELDTTEITADLAAAQSRIAQARAELEVLDRGGRAVELSTIASDLENARQELATGRREHDTLVRLEAKQAATRHDVAQAKDRVDRAELQIRALESRRGALVSPPDRSSAEARLRDAEAASALAQERIRKSVVRAPVPGTVYQFDLKFGAYLNAGDLVATIGQLERVRVKVFVDEPDLGRLAARLPVTITWDALPGRQWKGSVDRTPSQIVALGTRQVGEVLCVIENPKNDLLPGTNVNADIRTDAAEGVLTIAKEVIRREMGESGVFMLTGQTVAWKKIKLGIGSTTHTQVEGLNEGDAVAMPTGQALRDGMVVAPVFP